MLGIFLAMSTVTTVAAARTDSEIEQDIQESISQRHPTDNAQWWRGLGAGTPRVIIAMYEKSTDTYRRLRLVEGLAWFGNDARAVEFLKQQSDAAGQDDVVRNAAIKSIGQSQGAKEAEFVAKYLKHNDPETRLAAAKTLQGMDDARAKAMVDQYLREEKVPWIAGKLRGQFEKPHRPLQIIASSEDLVDSAFLGVWKGYLILPKPGPLGLIVTSVIFRVEKKGATTDLKGELLIAEKKQQKGGVGGATATATACATRVFEVKGLKAKGTKLSGTVVQTGRFGTDKSGADDNAFDGELQEVAEGGGAALLRLQAPKTGATFVLRREG